MKRLLLALAMVVIVPACMQQKYKSADFEHLTNYELCSELRSMIGKNSGGSKWNAMIHVLHGRGVVTNEECGWE
jgi:hypothetical protein